MLVRQMKLNKIPSFTLPLAPSVQTDKPLYSVGTLFMEEIWKDIPNYEGLYQASNLGRIKSLSKKVKTKSNSYRVVRERIMVIYNRKDGYTSLDLGRNNKHQIHRLVALTFIQNPFNKPTVNHKDGNPSNNKLNNLEWATQSEQQIHAYKTGLQKGYSPKGRNNKLSKVFYKYDMSGNLVSELICIKEYCKELGINPESIRRVLRGERGHYKKHIYTYKPL